MKNYGNANKRSWRTIASALFFAFAFFYLGFHVLNGERGVYALLKEERKRDTLQQELSDLRVENEVLKRNIAALGSDSLDLDLLDERARAVLGYASKDELLVYFNGYAE